MIYTDSASIESAPTRHVLNFDLKQLVEPPQIAPSFRNNQSLMQAGRALSFRPRRHIFVQGTPVQTIYQVENGVVFIYQLTKSGQRRILDFYIAGDVFGLRSGTAHQWSCQASTQVSVLAFDVEQLMEEAEADVHLIESLRLHFMAEHQRRQQHVILLGLTATERVAGFILNMARRTGQRDVVDLPMTRRDIADYLALTVETVSREVTSLRQSRAISLDDVYRIRILNRPQLEDRAGWV
jgi:CRP-like cAMP-binding protein